MPDIALPTHWVIAYGGGRNGAQLLNEGRPFTDYAAAHDAAMSWCRAGIDRSASVVCERSLLRSAVTVIATPIYTPPTLDGEVAS